MQTRKDSSSSDSQFAFESEASSIPGDDEDQVAGLPGHYKATPLEIQEEWRNPGAFAVTHRMTRCVRDCHRCREYRCRYPLCHRQDCLLFCICDNCEDPIFMEDQVDGLVKRIYQGFEDSDLLVSVDKFVIWAQKNVRFIRIDYHHEPNLIAFLHGIIVFVCKITILRADHDFCMQFMIASKALIFSLLPRMFQHL